MRRVIVTSQEQIVSADMLDFTYVIEQALYDDTVRNLLGNPTSAFWGDSFKVVPVAGLQVKITAGSGYIYDSTEIDPDVAVFKPIRATSDINITVSNADALLVRVDLICVKVARLTSVSESRLVASAGTSYPPSTTNQTLEKKNSDYRDYNYVVGTPGAGTPLVPAGYTKIATITVDALATSITSDKIEDDRTVARVPSTYVAVQPVGNLTSVILQNALEELQVDIDTNASNLSNHISTSAAHQAQKISFLPGVDPNFGGATNVQGAMENLSSLVGTGGLAAHIADPTDAHDASAISLVPFTSIASTDVQTAIGEVMTRFGVQHVNTTGAHGPNVTIACTNGNDALRITKSGSQHGLRVDATSTDHSAVEINQAGNQGCLAIVKTAGGVGNAITIQNAGTGYDILGNNWWMDKNGNASMIGSLAVGDNLTVNEHSTFGASGGLMTVKGFRLGPVTTVTANGDYTIDVTNLSYIIALPAPGQVVIRKITGGVDGQILVVIPRVSPFQQICWRPPSWGPGGGNVWLDWNQDNAQDTLTLIYNATHGYWDVLAIRDN